MKHKLMTRQERDAFIAESKDLEIPFFGVEPGQETAPSHNRYTNLTQRQYRAFMDAYRGAGSDSIQIGLGFKILGHILKHASVAYGEFISDSGEEVNLPELGDSLVGDFDSIVAPIARLDRDRAVIYENWLGLITGQDNLFSASSYKFTRYENGLHLTPKIDNLEHIDREIYALNRSAKHNVGPNRGCPALKFVLPHLWGIDVSGCIRDADYFATDIEAALGRTKVEA